jgi:glucose-6-phosphate 1-dehydrogenase
MDGDATLFARQDYVDEAWRIVDPVLNAPPAIHPYEPHTWGPDVVNRTILPTGGWVSPVIGD